MKRISSACMSELRRCEMTMVTASAACSRNAVRILCSVAASIAAVESSKTRIDGRMRSARAITRRWRWPPESETPRSPTSVWYFLGSVDVGVQLRRICRADDPVAVGPGVSVGNVVLDSGGEQEDVLLDDADRRAERFQRDVPDVLSVDRNTSLGYIVEPRDEVCDRRLPGSRRPDDPSVCPR